MNVYKELNIPEYKGADNNCEHKDLVELLQFNKIKRDRKLNYEYDGYSPGIRKLLCYGAANKDCSGLNCNKCMFGATTDKNANKFKAWLNSDKRVKKYLGIKGNPAKAKFKHIRPNKDEQ